MFDKRCAICGDMVGPYGDGKWLHVANQYPDPPHEVVLDGHMQRCGAAQGGMFCICDSLREERAAALDAAREAVAPMEAVVLRIAATLVRHPSEDERHDALQRHWSSELKSALDKYRAAIDGVKP